jgi:hypothetical protein
MQSLELSLGGLKNDMGATLKLLRDASLLAASRVDVCFPGASSNDLEVDSSRGLRLFGLNFFEFRVVSENPNVDGTWGICFHQPHKVKVALPHRYMCFSCTCVSSDCIRFETPSGRLECGAPSGWFRISVLDPRFARVSVEFVSQILSCFGVLD